MPIIDDSGSVIGIVTTLDILKVIKDNKNLDELSAKYIMSRNPAVLSQDATIDEIIDIMYRKGIDMIQSWKMRRTTGLLGLFLDKIP